MQEHNVFIYSEGGEEFIPKYGMEGDAGFDLRAYFPGGSADIRSDTQFNASSPLIILPGKHACIGTGLYASIPQGFEIQIRPRSGLAYKHRVSIVNTPGTIDSNYLGHIQILLENRGDKPFEVEHGDRIAQGLLKEVPIALFQQVNSIAELGNTNRGAAGFGSTGV